MSRQSRIDWGAQQRKAEQEVAESRRTGNWGTDNDSEVGERAIILFAILCIAVLLMMISVAGNGSEDIMTPVWTPAGVIYGQMLW